MLVRFRGKSEALSRFHCFSSQYLYSTSARTNFFVKYLINSLGFSKEEASLASTKVNSWKSLKKNPDLVLNFLKQTGFDKIQMKKLVSTSPKFLFYDVSKTLKPKFQCLMDIGLSGSDLVNVIAKDSTIVERGLVTHLKPKINCLRRTLGSDENVVKAIKRTSWLLSFGGRNVMENNLLLLKNYGVSDDSIQKLVLRNPRYITQKPEWVKDLLHRVEKDFRLSPDSSMFPYGFHTLASQKKARCEKKLEIFKSFGWSDDDILTMFRKLPYCIALSEVKIQKGLSLFMKELGFESAYLASHPSILIYSMEKRVVPRMQVLKILDEKKLERRKVALYTVVSLKEKKFIETFVLPYKDQVFLSRTSIVNSLPTITR
ncbi:uncharacterized protein [Solanum tuberosum]|uniref:uncharacterized protein isoform X1 n=1 Tax=Solanum tuberosum TaxID=4113 RepID=UPI000739F933|nr:PREDICTED: uncharacterized protein LOC102580515 isoform X1 [Solanum tuberosum]